MSSLKRISIAGLSFAVLWLGGIPAAHADDGPGVFRAAGVRLSVARTSFAGQFVDESPADRVPILGFAPGLLARLEFVRPGGVGIGLQPELGYGPRGADVELDGEYQGNARVSYLELPILARIESPGLGPVTFHVTAGPTLSFLLAAETESGTGNVADVTEDTSNLDVALAAGLGASIVVTPRIGLSLETRYVHGFLTTSGSGEVEFLNRALLFSLGVEVRFGVDETPSVEPLDEPGRQR